MTTIAPTLSQRVGHISSSLASLAPGLSVHSMLATLGYNWHLLMLGFTHTMTIAIFFPPPYPLSIIHYPLSSIILHYPPLSIIHYPLSSIIHYPLLRIRYPLSTFLYPLSIIHIHLHLHLHIYLYLLIHIRIRIPSYHPCSSHIYPHVPCHSSHSNSRILCLFFNLTSPPDSTSNPCAATTP